MISSVQTSGTDCRHKTITIFAKINILAILYIDTYYNSSNFITPYTKKEVMLAYSDVFILQ